MISVEVNAYSPSLDLFVTTRTATWFTATGGPRNFVDTRVNRLNTARFQPSIAFEVVVAVYCILQSIVLYMEYVKIGSLRQFLNQPWVAMEICNVLLFAAVFIVDIVNLVKVEAVSALFSVTAFPAFTLCCDRVLVQLKLHVGDPTRYVPLWQTIDSIDTETGLLRHLRCLMQAFPHQVLCVWRCRRHHRCSHVHDRDSLHQVPSRHSWLGPYAAGCGGHCP